MTTQDGASMMDPRSVAITGLTTFAWYAVPDVVGPRWARALTKSALVAGGLALGLAVTEEGRAARDGVRSARDAWREVAAGPDGEGVDRDDNVLAGDTADESTGPGPATVGAAALGAVAVVAAVAVAGEKWAYRRGERWRERGARLPHSRVGLIMGALAAATTALDPAVSFVATGVPAVPADRGTNGAARRR